MNAVKYRKWYLQENWKTNSFIMKTYPIPPVRINNHLILSEEAFQIGYTRLLCVGYEFRENMNVFRPVFSHKRQLLLDKVNFNIHSISVSKIVLNYITKIINSNYEIIKTF